MGFSAHRTYNLVIDDGDFEGLAVKVKGRTVRQVLLQDLAWENDPDLSADDKAKRYRELYVEFVDQVVEWNLEDDNGDPLPVTVDSVLDADQAVMLPILVSWLFRGVSVSAPLPKTSPAGVPSVMEQSIPMEPLSPNPVN